MLLNEEEFMRSLEPPVSKGDNSEIWGFIAHTGAN